MNGNSPTTNTSTSSSMGPSLRTNSSTSTLTPSRDTGVQAGDSPEKSGKSQHACIDGVTNSDETGESNLTCNRFSTPFLFSDMTVEVEGHVFHCHRAILSLWSPVFQAMFMNSCQEAHTNKVLLPNDRAVDILELFHHFYSLGGRDLDTEAALALLPVVHRYQVDQLLNAIEKRLCHSVSDSTALELFQLAEHYQLQSLRQAALERCARFDRLRLERDMKEIPMLAETQLEIYKRRISILEQVIHDIHRSFSISCVKVESKLERLPANHCAKHSRPFALNEQGEPCGACVDNMKVHIMDLCKRAMNKALISRETSANTTSTTNTATSSTGNNTVNIANNNTNHTNSTAS